MTLPAPERSPVEKLIGGLLLAIGILIASLSGLCSATFLVITLNDGIGQMFGSVMIIAIVGGPPLLIGILLIWLGRRMLRPRVFTAAPGAPDVFK